MKTVVRVSMTGTMTVNIEVEHEDGDDPTDITPEDAKRARRIAGVDGSWDITGVEVAVGY